MSTQALRMAVVGAGPVGLALAVHAAQQLPQAQLTLFDARAADADLGADGRTLALALGSVHLLKRLGAWPQAAAQLITEVHVSQAPPSLRASWARPEVWLRASEEGVPMLGAVLRYGELLAPLQRAWLAAQHRQPQRLRSAFGTTVTALTQTRGLVQLDAGVAEEFDLCVVAEGGVFAQQARKAIRHDYGQTAWVGNVELSGATAGRAIERFTRHGPLALLPLPAAQGAACRAALVWCVPSASDPVRELTDAQRIVVLNHVLDEAAGRVTAIGPLKAFALGLNAEASLVDARLVRIGNAAQTLHPVAGQGLNLGLRDAVALVAALRANNDLDTALRRVAWARAGDRAGMILATDILARSFTWQLPGLGLARGLGLAALQAAAPLKSALARQMMFGRR